MTIPDDVYNLCRTVFLQCEEFDGDVSLRAIFVIEKLKPFQDSLPTAISKRNRVDLFLGYIVDKCFGSEPILLIFLELLCTRYPQETALGEELNQCTALAKQTLSQPLSVKKGAPFELSTIRDSAEIARQGLNPITLERISRDCVQFYLKEISSSVENDERRVIAIIGDAGYGKTTILGDIYDDVRSKAAWVALVRCDNLSLEANLSPESLATALGKYICDNRASASITDITSSLNSKHGRGVLLIDTLDLVLNPGFIEPFHRVLREIINTSTTVVFTCRDYEYDNVLNPDVNLYSLPSNIKRHPVPRFSNQEIIKAAQAFFENKSKKLNKINKGKAFGEEIVALSAHDYQLREIICKPLLLRLLCELCETDGSVPQNLTASKLYRLYWNEKIAGIRPNSTFPIDVSLAELKRKQQRLCWKIAKTAFDSSYENLEIFVRLSDIEDFDEIDDIAYDKLRSEGILFEEKSYVDLVRFFHQSFLEYTIALWLDLQEAKYAKERLLETLKNPNALFDWWRILREYLTIARPGEFSHLLKTNKLDVNDDRAFYALAFAAASRDDISAINQLLPVALEQGTKYQKILFEATISTPTSHAEIAWEVILQLLQKGEYEIAANIAQKSREMLARLRPKLGSCVDAALFAIKERTVRI